MTEVKADSSARFSSPLRSLHTESFPALLEHLGISLLVTTYQAGKLVMFRADQGVLNTHFRGFGVPMGLALQGDRLAIGTAVEIWEYHNAPAVAAKLNPIGKHDACFLPRGSTTTGNIQIHEMAWSIQADPELWFINTRFSCLCTRDIRYSFVPRWQPPFISEIAPEDRCHLNGLAMVDGEPRFVTALGTSDQRGGWRENKRDGGVLMHVPSGEIITCGLSMPHSPRWHDGKLWVLNSGTGGLGTIDQGSSSYQEIATMPGFTRGFDISGRYASLGCRRCVNRPSSAASPVADRPLGERRCGVWAVDLVSGQTVAYVTFEEGVQEIFAVAVVPGKRFPDVINDERALLADSFILPDEPLDAVPSNYLRRADAVTGKATVAPGRVLTQ